VETVEFFSRLLRGREVGGGGRTVGKKDGEGRGGREGGREGLQSSSSSRHDSYVGDEIIFHKVRMSYLRFVVETSSLSNVAVQGAATLVGSAVDRRSLHVDVGVHGRAGKRSQRARGKRMRTVLQSARLGTS